MTVADPHDTRHSRVWNRDVLFFLAGQTVSMFGSMLVQYAVFWYVTLEFRSGVIMMLTVLFGFVPQAVVSVFGGVWADRHNRKFLIMTADGTIAVTTIVLGVIMLSGDAPLWVIFATLAIRSAGAGVQGPAVNAMIPQITPAASLMRVNGVLQSIGSVTMLIAPAVAGALFAWAASAMPSTLMGLLPIFAIDVVTAAIGIGLLAAVRVRAVERADDAGETPGYFTDMADGVRYVARHPLVRWLLVLYGILFMLTVAPSQLTPLLLVRSFPAGSEAGDVWNMSILEIAFSVGMALGGIAVAIWAAKRDRIRLIIAASVIFGLLSVALGLSPTVWIFFVFMFFTGLIVPFMSTPSMTLLQESVEPERQGRVFGFVGIVMALAMPVGMLIFGPLADVVPIQVLLIAAGLLSVIVVLVAVMIPAGRRAVVAARAATARALATDAPVDDEGLATADDRGERQAVRPE